MSTICTPAEQAGAQAPAEALSAKTYFVHFIDSRSVMARIVADSDTHALAIAKWAWKNRRDRRLSDLFCYEPADIEDIFENAFAVAAVQP